MTDGRQLLMLPDPAITPDRILNVDAQSASGHGVLVLPSTLFHECGYFRISVTDRDEAIALGLDTLTKGSNTLGENRHAYIPVDRS